MIVVLIETLVCILLATTIGWCVVLDRRLKKLKADEHTMRRTIVDLVGATERAERAIAGLRGIVTDCDETIAAHLRDAERHTADLAGYIRSGDDVIARIARIVETAGADAPVRASARPAPAAEPPPAAAPATRVSATLAAAQTFADRAQRRAGGQAA
ncbi:MAG: DUF6468 domain-containing protein [Burkholderiales bacterium]|jgi:hypothetical protein|nr:DUF6468 domain-containing protein [Burkholderiales bacterium]